MSASSEENIISPGGRRRFTVSSASSMDVQGIAVGEHDDAVPFSADLRRSLQNVSARSSALHRAMTMLGPLQIRSSRYDVLPRRGSLSSIRRRRAKVRKVRSPSFRARSGSIQPVVICKRSSTWSLASQANTNNPSGGGSSSTHTGINDTGRLWVVCRRSPNNLSPARNASAFDFNADSTTLNGGVGGGYGGSLRRDHRSDSFLSLRSLDNVPLGSSSGASSRLRRSDTTTSKLQNRAVHRSVSTSGFHRDLGKSHSLPFSVPKPSAGQRKPSSNRVLSRRTAHASKSLGVENMDGGGGSGPVTGQDQTRPLSPGVAIWDRVITKHWHTLVAYLKPHDCQDLLYQYDIVTWQQYRTIQSTEDDKDASSHLLYALRAGPPDAVQTFIGLLARVPGQENLAYMLHQEMNNVPRDHIDDAAQEAKSYVSPERSSETIQVHRSTSQPWNMLESSSLPPVLSVSPPPATLSPSSLPATNGTSNATSPPPTSVEHVAYPPAQANRDTGDGSQRLGVVTVTNDQYSVRSVDHTGRPLPQPPQQQQHPNSRSVDDLRLRPLPKSPEDQSPFRRGTIDSEHVSVPPPLALDSLQRGVEPIGRDSLQLENPLVRRRLPSQTSISGRQVLPYEVVGGGGGLEVPATGLVPPYETLTRVRGEADAAWTGGADAADARVGPVVVSPPYAEAQLLARENNPFAKIGGGGGGAANNIPVSASQEHATIMEVYADDTPDDVLAVSVEGNGGSFLDAEEPYDQGFIRPVANSRDGLRNQSVSSSEFSRTAVAGAASQSPSSREWVDSTSTTNPTPGALSMDSGELQIPGTPGNISRGSNERNIMAPSTGDELATPLELWMIAWISEYLYVDSDKVDASHFVASDMPSGLVADTTQGGKGICIVHLIFENLNVRQYKLGRKSILQSLAMGFNMREMKVVCRDVNHGQSMIMSMWTPHAVRDTIMRLAEEKSFVLLSAGIVLVRCTSRAVWCAEKKKHKKKKLRLSSKGKPKQDPVDLERVEVALDRTASELWLLMEPIENPIHHAVLTGNHILVDTLISIGLDINEPNKEGETPLHLASQIGHVEVVQLLADTGAAIHALNSSGMTPLHWAANQGNGEVVQVLLRAGADPNAVEQRHQATPLHTASVLGRPEVVQILLENGANVKAIDQDGHTASHLAVLFAPVTVEDDDLPDDYADILDILLCSGAQPTPRSHEWITPVHIASSQGQERLIQILLHYHADINAVDQRHWQTPLHFAAAAGKMSAVDLLVSSGADIAAIDKDGRTAGDVAATAEIRTYLEEQLQNLPTDFTVVGELEDEDDMLVTDV
eukprot:scpid18941/ scgid3385/ Ankyrin-3; Ankyrin-G